MNSLEAFNRHLFLMLNGPAQPAAWQLDLALVSASALIYLVPVLLTGLWLVGGEQNRLLALRIFCVVLVSLACNQLIGLVWTHPRPFMIPLGHVFVKHAADSSFPSDHVTVLGATLVTLMLEHRRLAALAFGIVTLLIAWARIYVGVHFPLDMLGALFVAILISLLLKPVWQRHGHALFRTAQSLYHYLFARPLAHGWLRY